MVAVAQTPREPAGSFLTAVSEIGHRIPHARWVRPEVVTPSRSGGHLRSRAAAFRDGFMQQPLWRGFLCSRANQLWAVGPRVGPQFAPATNSVGPRVSDGHASRQRGQGLALALTQGTR